VWAADNAVFDGIQSVSTLLAAAPKRLVVHESCAGIFSEVPGYVWDEKAQQRGEDKPIKGNDDSLDALRYGVHTHRQLWTRWPKLSVAA
jgi:hypothetical protein